MEHAAELAHSHRRTAFASTSMVGIQGPTAASVGGRTDSRCGSGAGLAPGGRRNRGNPRGPYAGRQKPVERVTRTSKPRAERTAVFLSARKVAATANDRL